jgi:hypothetical protein
MSAEAWQPIDRPIPLRKDRTIITNTGHAAGLLTAITAQLPDALARIHHAYNGHPGATRTDTTRTQGHTTTLDEHGTPMPAISDPTGENAIRPDPAHAAHVRIEQLARRIYTDTLALQDELVPWQGRAPLSLELRETESVNTPGCESCAKIDGHHEGTPWWNQPRTTIRLGLLGKPIRVCAWCETQYRKDGRLPTKQELEDHRDGKRRKRPA